MNRYVRYQPVRLLLVEDHEEERIGCRDFLKRNFPKAEIHEAASRSEANELIERAHSEQRPYDCALLDLELPDGVGGGETADTSLACRIVELFGHVATRLVQWTAYPEDNAIARFKSEKKIPQSGIVYEVISKMDAEWPAKMALFISRIIAEKTVGRWLDDPYFLRMRQRSATVVSKRPRAQRAPVSMPGFMHALTEVWPLLESHRRFEAMATFQGTDWEITEDAGHVNFKNKRAAKAIQDAQENAKIFKEIMAAQHA